MDFGNWPAWIALIVAIVSPTITTLLTNRHQSKMKRLELNQQEKQHRMEILENYARSVGAVIASNTETTLSEYNQCLGKAYIYLPKERFAEVSSLDFMIRSNKIYDQTIALFTSICRSLSDENVGNKI